VRDGSEPRNEDRVGPTDRIVSTEEHHLGGLQIQETESDFRQGILILQARPSRIDLPARCQWISAHSPGPPHAATRPATPRMRMRSLLETMRSLIRPSTERRMKNHPRSCSISAVRHKPNRKNKRVSTVGVTCYEGREVLRDPTSPDVGIADNSGTSAETVPNRVVLWSLPLRLLDFLRISPETDLRVRRLLNRDIFRSSRRHHQPGFCTSVINTSWQTPNPCTYLLQ